MGIRNGTTMSGPVTAIGGLSIGQSPFVQDPVQHGALAAHARPEMQPPGTVAQRPPTHSRGEPSGDWQSPWVAQMPPSTGFATHLPYWQPNEQHCASAVQEE